MSGAWDGLILMGLLAVLLIIFVRKLRPKIHIPWATSGIVVFFVFVCLLLWANSYR